MKLMGKLYMLITLVLCSFVFLSISVEFTTETNASAAYDEIAIPDELSFPIDISGKIVDQEGNLFRDEVILAVYTETIVKDEEAEYGVSEKEEIFEQKIKGGYFSWKGRASRVIVVIKKEGYHSTGASPQRPSRRYVIQDNRPIFIPQEIRTNDIIIYMIPQGRPSTLEYTGSIHTSIPYDPTGKVTYGWSFKKRWYFSSTDKDVDMVLKVDENDRAIYTMKEPGGFVFFPGYPEYESKPDERGATFDWMPQAPESGYVQMAVPTENKSQYSFYYFRTPNGKYGKIMFDSGANFDYYLQPDGSRNLEVEKIWSRPPLNPKAEHMPDDPEAYPVDE